jgi:hypothetical protein
MDHIPALCRGGTALLIIKVEDAHLLLLITCELRGITKHKHLNTKENTMGICLASFKNKRVQQPAWEAQRVLQRQAWP